MANKIVNHPFNPFRNTDFDDISTKIDAKNTMKDIEDIIENKRKDIFDILSTGRANGNNDTDEKSLKKMKDTLEGKRTLLEDKLGEVTTGFNISSDNTDLVNFCKDILNKEDLTKKDNDLGNKCGNLLEKLQNVYLGKGHKKLFSGKKDPADSTFKDLTSPDSFNTIFGSKNPTELQKNIDDFISKVYNSRDNSFSISKSKLYGKDQAEIAARIAIFLHCMQKAINEGKISNKTKVKAILNKLENEQIPKIRGLYNLQKEEKAVNAEYNTLTDIRKNDITDITWTDTTTDIDLTDSFEGKSDKEAKDIDFYNLNKDEIKIAIGNTTYSVNDIILKDTSGEKSGFNTQMKFSSGDYTLCLKIGGNEIEVGKLCINYSNSKKALFVLKQDANIISNLNTLGITGNVDIEIPIMAVKNVASARSHTGQVSLTRNIKITVNGISTPTPNPNSTPTLNPIPTPTSPKPKEWTATISSVEKVHSEEAAYLAEEKDREDFDKLGELSLLKISTWHPRSRMKHFISREYKRNKAIKKHMQAVKGRINIRHESVVNASNRHELEYGDDKRKGGIDGKIINYENPDVNRLCVEYLKTNMNDAVFEKKFNEIISHDTIIGDMIRNNKMNYLGSNILLKLKQERAEQVMMDEIGSLLIKDMNASTLEMKDDYNESFFKAELQKIADRYFQATQSNFPIEIRKLLEESNNKDLMLQIIQNWKAQLQANVKNLRMQLQLLDNTTGAYEIDNKDKEKALWQRFGHGMDKHRALTIGGSALLGTGMLGLGSVIGGPFGAGIATGLLAIKMGIMSAAKKASHYTKEQKGQEKRLTHGLNIEKQDLENIRKVMEGAPWYSWRKRKAKRQYKIYQEATQHRIADTEYLTKKIQSVLNSTANLDVSENENERNILEGYLINALVRLDYYKECGHNFVASQNRTKIEQDFNTLYKAVQDGVFRLNESKLSATNPREKIIKDGIDDIRTNDTNYNTLKGALKKDYETSFTAFKKRRGSLERRYGLSSMFIYGGSALFIQRMLGSGLSGNHIETVTTPSTTSTTLHPQVKSSLISSGVPSSKITAIENALKSAPTSGGSYNPKAFRTFLKNETGWTEVQLNNWMSNHFMKDVLWQLNEGGVSEFKNALLSAHINTLSPGDPLFTKAEAFLSSPKIGILRPGEGTTVLKNLQDYLSGAKSYNSFPPDMRIKMGHFGHMAIHNDTGAGSALSKELLNTVTTAGGTKTEVIDKSYFFDGVGMPLYANTYRKRMIPKDEEMGVILENSDPGYIHEGDEFVTTDSDGSSTSGPSSGAAPRWI